VGHHASKEENCHPSTWQCEADNSKGWLGTALPSTLQSRFGPLRLPFARALEKITWEVTITRLTRQSGGRAKLVARELERTSAAEAIKILKCLQKCIDGWRFCRKTIKKMPRFYWHHFFFFFVQWVLGALALGVKWPGCELTTHLHLVPRSKNEWSYTSTLPIHLHGVVFS
jgi:hypothetical protein